MSRRHVRFIPILAVLLFLLAACGPNANRSEPAAAGQGPRDSSGVSSGGTELNVAGEIFVHGFSYESTDDIIARDRVETFREAYPDATVTFSESGFDAPTFLTAVQGGDAPDVVRIPRDIIGSYIARGVLMPLDDCISRAGVDTSIYRAAALQQLTSDGTIYGLPDFFDTAIWMVTNPVWQEAGLDPASFDWSDWDAIADANEAMIKGQGPNLERIGIDPKVAGDYSFFSLWSYANGAPLLSEDGNESLLDDPRVAEALTFARDLIQAHGSPSQFLDFRNSTEKNGDFFGSPNQFTLGTEGAFPQQEWYLNVIADNTPDAAISFAPFMTRDGEPITFQEGNGWAIVEGSDNVDAACGFITTMVATDTWVHAAEARKSEREDQGQAFTGTYTGNTEADEVIFGELVDLSDFPALQQGVDAVLDAQEHAYALPRSPAGEEMRQAVLTAIDAVMTGTDPAEALAAADEEAQAAIDAAQ
jgi:multiple sugar transport system substrate-binding protein